MTVLNYTIFDIPLNNNSHFAMKNFNNSITNNSQSIVGIIQILLFVFIGILAIVYIIIILSRKTLRSNKFNWLTINLCFASSFFAFIQLLLSGMIPNNVVETAISCRSREFIINMATCDIMYIHCSILFCRLLPVRYSHNPLFRSCHWLLSNIGMSWIVGFLAALPYLFFDGFICSSSYSIRFLQIYTTLATIVVPIIIVAICNISIFRYVRQSTKRIHDLNNNATNKLNKRDMYLCKIILLTFCVFFIGWSPLFVEQLFIADQNSVPLGLRNFLKILLPACLLGDVILLIYSDHPVCNLFLKVFKCHGMIPCLIKS